MAARGRQPGAADPEDRPVRAHRRLARRARARRRLRADRARAELVRREPDPRRRPRVGQPVVHSTSGRRSRATPRSVSPASPSSSRPRSRTAKRRRRSHGWRTSRRRCGAWRRWSRRAVPPGELFVAVVAEVGGLLGADLAGMIQLRARRDGHRRGDVGRRRRAPGGRGAGGRSRATGWPRRSRGRAGRPARTTGPTSPGRSPPSSASSSGSTPRSEARSSSRAGCGAPCSSTRRAGRASRRHRGAPRRLHGARRDRDLQQRGAGRGGAAGGRAGGPAARGDAGRA